MKSKRDQKIETRKALLMETIEETPGLSLFKLAINSGLPYVTAHRYMTRLEQDGEIQINRSEAGGSRGFMIQPHKGR